MELLEEDLRNFELFTENQLDFIFKRNKTLTIESIDDFYINMIFLNDVKDVDWKKMIDLLKGDSKMGNPNISVNFYRFYFYKKLDNLELNKKWKFLFESEKFINKKNILLKKFISNLKIYFLLRYWEKNELPKSIGDLDLEKLLFLISGFKDYKEDKFSDKIMSLLFNRASGQEEGTFNSFSIISNFRAGKKTKLAVKKKIKVWLLSNEDKHIYLKGLKEFIKKWKIEFDDNVNKILNKK